MFTHVVIRSYRDSSGTVIQSTENVAADNENNIDVAVAHNASDAAVVWNIDRSKLKSVALQCDVAVTIHTNAASGGSPTDTIAVAAGQQIIWSLASDTLAKCPFTASVTAGIFLTGAGTGADGTLKIRALLQV